MTNTHHFPSIIKIIAGTPIWVWCVFAYLIFVGIKASKQRIVYIPKLFIIPVILSALKYKIFLSASFAVYLSYFTCLLLSIIIGFKIAKGQKFETLNNLQVKLPGDYSTIFILMTFFIIKYIFGYINAIDHELYQDLSVLELSASGIFSGYFLGKAIFYLKSYSKKI
jgi:hypothetical protein